MEGFESFDAVNLEPLTLPPKQSSSDSDTSEHRVRAWCWGILFCLFLGGLPFLRKSETRTKPKFTRWQLWAPGPSAAGQIKQTGWLSGVWGARGPASWQKKGVGSATHPTDGMGWVEATTTCCQGCGGHNRWTRLVPQSQQTRPNPAEGACFPSTCSRNSEKNNRKFSNFHRFSSADCWERYGSSTLKTRPSEAVCVLFQLV